MHKVWRMERYLKCAQLPQVDVNGQPLNPDEAKWQRCFEVSTSPTRFTKQTVLNKHSNRWHSSFPSGICWNPRQYQSFARSATHVYVLSIWQQFIPSYSHREPSRAVISRVSYQIRWNWSISSRNQLLDRFSLSNWALSITVNLWRKIHDTDICKNWPHPASLIDFANRDLASPLIVSFSCEAFFPCCRNFWAVLQWKVAVLILNPSGRERCWISFTLPIIDRSMNFPWIQSRFMWGNVNERYRPTLLNRGLPDFLTLQSPFIHRPSAFFACLT